MGRKAVPCQGCRNHGEYCQRCREITKAELAAYLRDDIPIYLSERNRAKKSSKHIDEFELAITLNLSCREAAKRFGVSAQTISRARRNLAKKYNRTLAEIWVWAKDIQNQKNQ